MVTYVMEMNHCETRRPVLPDGMVCERSVRTRARCAYRVPLRTWVVAVTGGGRLAAIEKILVNVSNALAGVLCPDFPRTHAYTYTYTYETAHHGQQRALGSKARTRARCT